MTGALVSVKDQIAQFRLGDRKVYKTQFLRPDLIEDHAADGSAKNFFLFVAIDGVLTEVRVRHLDPVMNFECSVCFRVEHLVQAAEERHSNTLRRLGARLDREIIGAENDVLGRGEDRLAGRGREDIVGRHHQQLALENGLKGQRHVNGHLVSIEIRIVGGADKRMNSDGFAFDQDRLERLDGKSVEGRRAVEQHRMALGHFLENIPNLG